MLRPLLLALTAAPLLAASGVAHAAGTPAQICAGAKQKAAGTMAGANLKCHAKATRGGIPPDEACLTKASAKLAKAFAQAEARGGCATTGDFWATEDLLEVSASTIVVALRLDVGADRCGEAKLMAAGTAAQATLGCHAKATGRGLAVDPGCLARAEARLTTAFAQAEARSPCLTTGDAAAAESRVDDLVAQVVGWTTPPCSGCPSVPPAGADNGAAFVSQSVSNPMSSGGTARVIVEMQNTGTTTWRANSEYNLGSQNPQDNGVWGLGRVGLASDVPPGATYTFSFDVRAPTVAQNQAWAFQWRMVQDGVEWFGDFTPNIDVIVQPWTQPPADTLSNSYICPGFPDRCVGMCGDGCNGINLGSQGGLVQKWTCECLKHDLVPPWCSGPGPFRPGCQDTFLFNPNIATASCFNPDPNGVCDAERSFGLKPNLGEGGLAQCDLTRNHVGNPATYLSPLEYCSTTGPFVLLPLRPPVAAPTSGEIWLGSTTLISDATKIGLVLAPPPGIKVLDTRFVRSHPRFGPYDSEVDGALMTFAGTGRAVIGISGKGGARMYIFRVGPDSLLCTDPHFTPEGGCDRLSKLLPFLPNLCGKKVCGSADGTPTEEALEHLYFDHNFDASGIKQVVFRHTVGGNSGDTFCGGSGTFGHSFKWCFVNNIPPGTYLAAAKSAVKAGGLARGHMTADTYWFQPAPAGCTPSCAGKPCGSDNGCGTGTCCSGSGCTVAACGTCQQPNACGSGCTNSPGGTFCWSPGGQAGTCDGGGTCIETPSGTCSGNCGGFAGSCWCDDSCESTGDCCPDKCGYCGCGDGDPCGGLPRPCILP